uniref:Putative mediator of RNA polymerase II transcription subunit 15 isoform X2 n=1 Tax=Davidia involucrata TaxID=16924 RepID=A0A5B7AS83_DAVIN
MSASRGIRNRAGEDRFYSPPAMRRYYQQQQQSQLQKLSKPKSKSSVESEKKIESDDRASSTTTTPSVSSSFSPPRMSNLTNLDRFLEHTTPMVPAQYFSKTSMRGWRTREDDFHPYFILGDLWESFKEWSAYGAGVPLLLNGSDSVVQYYVPYLSGIQLYIDPSKPFMRLRRPGEESDAESSRETSSDGSDECGGERGADDVQGASNLQNPISATAKSFNRHSLRNNLLMGPSVDEGEISNPPGLLIFQYLEEDLPYSREPLADKIAVLASQFPELRTYRSCDLAPASWISVAWYPIYRIPTGPTLQNLDACFLTFHSLSTPCRGTGTDWPHDLHNSSAKEVHSPGMSLKLSLPIFGLACYKFKVSVWNPNGVYECQKVTSLMRAADNWLRLLQVDHPDYSFFVSHYSYWR